MPCLRRITPFLMWLALTGPAVAQAPSWETLVAAGQTAFQAGDFDAAGEKFDAALHIAETYSELDTRLATTLNNIAAVHYVKGEYAAAEPLFRRALSIRERSLGRNHAEVATSLNNLAAVNRKQGDLRAAAPALQRALGIREEALGPTHPSTLAIIHNLAAVHRDLGQDAQSEDLWRQSLDRRHLAGGNDADLEADILERLADIQQDQGRYREAAESLVEAVGLRRRIGADVSHLEAQAAAIRDMIRSTDVIVAAAPAPRAQAMAGLSRPPARRAPLFDRALVPQTPIAGMQPATAAPEKEDKAIEPAMSFAVLPGAANHQAKQQKPSMAADPNGATGEQVEKLYFLQLISLQSEGRVQTEWMRLQDVYADVLSALPADVVRADLGDHGTWYRLQAGPVTDFDVASAACVSLVASDQACLIVER